MFDNLSICPKIWANENLNLLHQPQHCWTCPISVPFGVTSSSPSLWFDQIGCSESHGTSRVWSCCYAPKNPRGNHQIKRSQDDPQMMSPVGTISTYILWTYYKWVRSHIGATVSKCGSSGSTVTSFRYRCHGSGKCAQAKKSSPGTVQNHESWLPLLQHEVLSCWVHIWLVTTR